jgi:hypothetical protein
VLLVVILAAVSQLSFLVVGGLEHVEIVIGLDGWVSAVLGGFLFDFAIFGGYGFEASKRLMNVGFQRALEIQDEWCGDTIGALICGRYSAWDIRLTSPLLLRFGTIRRT